MNGQQLYEWLGSLTPEQRSRQVLRFDSEMACLEKIEFAKLHDSPKFWWMDNTAATEGWEWIEPNEFSNFQPCIILMYDQSDVIDP